jgi:hypothetical protein
LAARSGVEIFAGGQFQSFPTRVPVSPGEVLGLRVHSMNAGCTFFTGAGDTAIATGGAPDIAPGESMMTTSTLPNQRVNVSATLEPDFDRDGFGDETQDRCSAPGPDDGCPSNSFSFGKLKRNKHKGTATLPVNVPGAGVLTLSGKGVKHTGATGSEVPSAAGTVNLAVKPKTKIKKKLKKQGRAKVRFTVAFAPTGGFLAKQSERVKLIER